MTPNGTTLGLENVWRILLLFELFTYFYHYKTLFAVFAAFSLYLLHINVHQHGYYLCKCSSGPQTLCIFFSNFFFLHKRDKQNQKESFHHYKCSHRFHHQSVRRAGGQRKICRSLSAVRKMQRVSLALSISCQFWTVWWASRHLRGRLRLDEDGL